MQRRAMIFTLIGVLGAGGLIATGMNATASPDNGDNKLDYHEARELREQGKILPLTEILQRAAQAHPGQVIEVELKKKRGRHIYELEIITSQDRVIEVKYDAASGEQLSVELED